MAIDGCSHYNIWNYVEGFGGELWPSRLIGFSLGMFMYALLTWLQS